MNLLGFTDHGGLPDPERVFGKGKAGVKSELRYSMSPESMAIVERGMEALAEVEGRHLSMEEASVHLFSQYLRNRVGDGYSLNKVMAEARKDVQAGCYRMERLVMAARDVAREFGLLEMERERSSDQARDDVDRAPEDAAGSQSMREPVVAPVATSATCPGQNPATEFVGSPGAASATESAANAFTSIGVDSLKRKQPQRGQTKDQETNTENAHGVESRLTCVGGEPVPTGEGGDKGEAEAGPTTASHPHSNAEGETASKESANKESVWLPFVAAEISVCPSDETLLLASPNQASWRNKRLKYNHGARGTTKAQRQDLLRRDGYCCPTPGCPNRLWLQVHHLKMYSHGGVTAEWNLLPLCLGCHTNVHEGHMIIKGCPERGTLEFYDAHDRRLGQGAPLERATWVDSYIERGGEETRAFLYLQGLSSLDLDLASPHQDYQPAPSVLVDAWAC